MAEVGENDGEDSELISIADEQHQVEQRHDARPAFPRAPGRRPSARPAVWTVCRPAPD